MSAKLDQYCQNKKIYEALLCILNSSLSSVHICSSRTVHRSHAQLILPDVLDPILPIRFRPMPGLISSTVGFEFSNVIFIQFSHNLDRVSNCTVLISQREECVAALIGTYVHVHCFFFLLLLWCMLSTCIYLSICNIVVYLRLIPIDSAITT